MPQHAEVLRDLGVRLLQLLARVYLRAGLGRGLPGSGAASAREQLSSSSRDMAAASASSSAMPRKK